MSETVSYTHLGDIDGRGVAVKQVAAAQASLHPAAARQIHRRHKAVGGRIGILHNLHLFRRKIGHASHIRIPIAGQVPFHRLRIQRGKVGIGYGGAQIQCPVHHPAAGKLSLLLEGAGQGLSLIHI